MLRRNAAAAFLSYGCNPAIAGMVMTRGTELDLGILLSVEAGVLDSRRSLTSSRAYPALAKQVQSPPAGRRTTK